MGCGGGAWDVGCRGGMLSVGYGVWDVRFGVWHVGCGI